MSSIQDAAAVIRAGGIVAYPTESVYGLGCDPLRRQSVERLLAIKQRSRDKGLILLAADIGQLEPFLAPLPEAMAERVFATWPGPVTWLIPASEQTPVWIRGEHASVAVRVTDHPLAAGLCRACGMALVSTSANRTGEPPLRDARAVRAQLGKDIDYVLKGPVGGRAQPSEIRDALTGAVIRPGA